MEGICAIVEMFWICGLLEFSLFVCENLQNSDGFENFYGFVEFGWSLIICGITGICVINDYCA